MRFQPTGSFTVKSGGIFKLENTDGFSGSGTTAINSTNSPSIVLEPGSAVEYSKTTAQTITPFTPAYSNLRISGSGIKSFTANEILVGETLHIASGTLQVDADKVLTVTDKVTVINPAGVLDIKDSGSLVQITNVNNATTNVNVGNIKMARVSEPMYRYDFTYWSSPVTEDSNFTLNALSPLTRYDKYFKWNLATQSWVTITNGAQNMSPGHGYILRAPDNFPTNPALTLDYNATFIGRANNGTITVPTVGTTNTDPTLYKYNLLGNPYPSAIDADKFVTANANVGGTLYFWTHNSALGTIPNSFGGYMYNNADYALYNITGATGVGVQAATETSPDPNYQLPDGKIGAGQGFFIRGIGTEGAATATFDNTMRVRTAAENNLFFRNTGAHATEQAIEKHRIWLNLTNQSAGFSQNLTGYIEGATDGIDRLYDGEPLGNNAVSLYTLAGTNPLKIQGLALPFNVGDLIPMGYSSAAAGPLQIKLDHVDGLFETQNIYVEDLLLNVIHDIKQSPYNFVTEIGTFNNRFMLRFTTESLANDDFNLNEDGFVITVKNRKIELFAAQAIISDVAVYDLLGRLVFEKENVNATTFAIENVVPNQQTLVVKTTLESGQVISRKIVY